MRIKRIEIVGFKSFVDKATLDFQEGITAVVGPNGCGKSNIVDAIRWAMGEQSARNLRGRSMEDVIFGGSESRRPLGMAEVSMIFSNEDGLGPSKYRDYAEIMVTRRLYRNGDSEYLLNKTPCRLLDITELFMDTGVGARAYSIIEQGKIGMILNAKPEDRRFLIEEAAGVTKYKSRKKSALRKIEATKQNLLRLGDIVSEVRRQMNSLKRQAQKAERYRAYRQELKAIETRFAREQFLELQQDAERTSRSEREQQQALEELSGTLEAGELQLEEMRLRQVAEEKKVTQAQERVFHLGAEIEKVEGRIGLGEKEVESLERQKERLHSEALEASLRLEELDREEANLKEARVSLAAKLESEAERLAEGEILLGELAGQEQELAHRLEESRADLYTLLTGLSRFGSQYEEARRRLKGLDERTSRNRSEAVTLREQMAEAQEGVTALRGSLEQFRRRRAALQEERSARQESIRKLRGQLDESEATLLVRREELNRRRSRLDSLRQLEKDLEGYGQGIKALLGDSAFGKRFAGMAADALEVPARHETAVEAVLGERLQALLAHDGRDAREALEFLGREGGRCTFLLPETPLDEMAAFPEGESVAGLLKISEEHRSALAALLAGAYLVPSLDPFFKTALPPGVSLVTSEGETLTWRGEFTGGGRQALDQGLLHKKRQIKELSSRVDSLSGEVETLQAGRADLRDDLAATEEALREVEAALHRKELKVVDSEKDLDRLEADSARLEERVEVLSLEEDQLHEEQEELERLIEEATRGRDELDRQKADQEEVVARLQEELQVMRREVETVREGVTSRKVAVASLREREEGGQRSLEHLGAMRSDLRGRVVLIRGRQEEGDKEKERLAVERQRLRTELDLLVAKREEEARRLTRIREAFEAKSGGIEKQESSLRELRREVNRVREDLGAVQMKGRELQMNAEHLRQSILERYRIDLAEESAAGEEAFDGEKAERRLGELRRLIEAVGEVNLTAIEEFRELEERWQFLTTQQEDLRRSLEGLQTAIGKINRTTRKRFRETFAQVNTKFREVFPRLFRGGRAELKLTDENDLLETGIEIVAQPPGKKLQNVNLLSGGEKALTAVALIFSIFMIKPSPFCMLDEVDAPLDDANIGRFNDIVRQMSERSQFIIITHNKRTMEIADTLYGVTMEEPGVSKLVSVRMNEFSTRSVHEAMS